jgi:hypothetical protein
LEINLRLCDLVNGDFLAHGKDVVKALRNRLTPGRRSGETETNARALFALEMCMKNCGGRFHAMVAAKDVPQVMVRLCEKAPTLEVRDKCLTLVEEWAANLRREPAFAEAFHALRRAGYRFPNPQQGHDGATREVPAPVAAENFNGRGDWSARTDISEADRNAIAAALAEEEEEIRAAAIAEEEARRVERARVAAANEGRRGIYPSHIATGVPVNAPPHLAGENDFERALRESERTAAEDVARRQQVSSTTTTAHAVAHTPQDVAKLKADVGVAKNSLQIFSRTLDATDLSQPATKNGLQGGIASDLAGQCRAMQPRLIELISNAHDEELLASAIELNEALTKEIARFDLMTRACSGDADAFARLRGGGTQSTTKAATTESLLSQLDEGLRVASSPPASTSNPFDHPMVPSPSPPTTTTNPFQRPLGGPSPSPPQTQSIPAMRVNPIFDGIYAPDASPPHAHRSLPLGSSAMNGVASASPSASPASSARAHHRPSPISDPFADLSAAAAVRVARSPHPRSGGPGAHRPELPDV